jgi:hypothetical protein
MIHEISESSSERCSKKNRSDKTVRAGLIIYPRAGSRRNLAVRRGPLHSTLQTVKPESMTDNQIVDEFPTHWHYFARFLFSVWLENNW